MTVIPFERPSPPKPPKLLYEVDIYENATHFRDPNRDEPDKRAAANALFDSTFHVFDDLDQCVMLVMFGAERSDSIRRPGAFDTPQQKAWLRRRMATLYQQVTGEELYRPGILQRLRTLIDIIHTRLKGADA